MFTLFFAAFRSYASDSPAVSSAAAVSGTVSAVPDGLQTIDQKIYYYENGSPAVNCLKTVNSAIYYFGADGSALKNSWKKMSDGSQYYFGADGIAYSGCSRLIDGYYYVFNTNGKLCTRSVKGLVNIGGFTYFVSRGGMAVSGWQIVNDSVVYAYPSGKIVKNQKVSYISLNSNGYAKNKYQALAKIYARKFIDRHTKSTWSRKKKLNACFWYILKHRHYVAHYISDRRASTTNGWQYKAAVEMLSTRRLTGNCRSFASSIAAIAKELGYKPVIYSMSWHSVVRIGNKWYDNMYGGLCGIKKRSYYSSARKKFTF